MFNLENRLIAGLPPTDRERLLAVAQSVSMQPEDVLGEAGNPIAHVYLPTDGYIALAPLVDGSPSQGVALVGREGMVGAQLALGTLCGPLRALVQGAGISWRIETEAFRRELFTSLALRNAVDLRLSLLVAELARSAACSHRHRIGQRLARWLLMTQDRAFSDRFHITHEFLARMLGVRRVGITSAASEMQRAGLIEYRRGDLVVLNRVLLKAAACSCYSADRKALNSVG